MDHQLMELQDILADKGWIESYQNGANQCGVKKSSEAEVYLQLSKNYMAIMRQLEDLIPETTVYANSDPLSEYV